MRHIKKMAARGLIDPEKDDPFELFISSTAISCDASPRGERATRGGREELAVGEEEGRREEEGRACGVGGKGNVAGSEFPGGASRC